MSKTDLEALLERPYNPPALYVYEEVEIGGGYHTLSTCSGVGERGWSEPYKKSGVATYRNRIVRVPFGSELPLTITANVGGEYLTSWESTFGCPRVGEQISLELNGVTTVYQVTLVQWSVVPPNQTNSVVLMLEKV